MITIIIICTTLIVLACIICYTVYKLKNNNELTQCYDRIGHLEESVYENNEWFHKHWDALIEYKIKINECVDLLKNLNRKESEK